MKRGIAWITAFVIGISVCPFKAMASEKAAETLAEDSLKPETEILEGEEKNMGVEEDAVQEITTLEVPQKLEVVIDPWELDGKGQIYSEPYSIQNKGKTAGSLTLNFSCKPKEGSEVNIWTDKEGIHEDAAKSVYIKAVFGDETEIVLSQEQSEYQIELQPGEEVTVYFGGEVNENASAGWDNSGIEVDGFYVWKVAEEALSEAKEEEPLEINEEEELEKLLNDRKNYATPSNAEPEKQETQQSDNNEDATESAQEDKTGDSLEEN